MHCHANRSLISSNLSQQQLASEQAAHWKSKFVCSSFGPSGPSPYTLLQHRLLQADYLHHLLTGTLSSMETGLSEH